ARGGTGNSVNIDRSIWALHCLIYKESKNNFCIIEALFTISGDTMTTIIVFSHFRWDFAYQRSQHLLTRLAENYKIVFIEEPVFHDDDSFFETSAPGANVTVLKPYTPVTAKGFHDEQLPHLI